VKSGAATLLGFENTVNHPSSCDWAKVKDQPRGVQGQHLPWIPTARRSRDAASQDISDIRVQILDARTTGGYSGTYLLAKKRGIKDGMRLAAAQRAEGISLVADRGLPPTAMESWRRTPKDAAAVSSSS
jgi:hypothetical protein